MLIIKDSDSIKQNYLGGNIEILIGTLYVVTDGNRSQMTLIVVDIASSNSPLSNSIRGDSSSLLAAAAAAAAAAATGTLLMTAGTFYPTTTSSTRSATTVGWKTPSATTWPPVSTACRPRTRDASLPSKYAIHQVVLATTIYSFQIENFYIIWIIVPVRPGFLARRQAVLQPVASRPLPRRRRMARAQGEDLHRTRNHMREASLSLHTKGPQTLRGEEDGRMGI
jgi:hypothetical protein